MRFFKFLDEKQLEKIFYIKPSSFNIETPRELLSYALGATLYMPGTRENIDMDLLKFKQYGSMSVVVCCEDAIDDKDVILAERNLFSSLKKLEISIENGEVDIDDIPMVFMRVKNFEHFERVLENSENFKLLCGFIFPKFSIKNNGENYFYLLKRLNALWKRKFYAMPILESEEIIHKEKRIGELLSIKTILDNYKDLVLNIRVGATDLSGLYAIRREFDQTVYDISIIRDCITDIINIFLRAGSEYVVSGPVWEYFSSGKRMFKPLLRENAFRSEMGEEGLVKRKYLIDQYIDGLIKETFLDRTNGLTGKTVIHPSHISIVNALQVVTKEEYEDATMIMECSTKGVYKSTYCNKMNEPRPHLYWAEKILKKSKIYGVLNEERNYTSLFV